MHERALHFQGASRLPACGSENDDTDEKRFELPCIFLKHTRCDPCICGYFYSTRCGSVLYGFLYGDVQSCWLDWFLCAPGPRYVQMQGNKIGAAVVLWVLGNSMHNSLTSTGAFEISINGHLVGERAALHVKVPDHKNNVFTDEQ